MPTSSHGRGWFSAGVVIALLLTLGGGVGGLLTRAAAQASVTEAQVIAQGTAWLPAEPVAWWVGRQTAPTELSPSPLRPLGFILGESGTTTVITDGVPGDQLVWLDAGEALFVPRDTRQDRLSTGFAATYYSLELLPAAGQPDPGLVPIEAPFTPSPDLHELSLRRAVLAPGAASAIPAGAHPTLVLATAGTIGVNPESGDGFLLAAGEATTIAGAAMIMAAGEQPASYVAATIDARSEQAPVSGVADLGIWIHVCPPGVTARPSMADAGCVITDPLASGVDVTITGPNLAVPLTLADSEFGDAGARLWPAVPFGSYTLTATLPPGAAGYAVRPGIAGFAVELRPDGAGYDFTIDGGLFDPRGDYWRVNLDLYLLYP